MIFPNGSVLFQKDASCNTAKTAQELETRRRVQGADLTSKFPGSHSDLASQGSAGQTSQSHGCSMSQLRGLLLISDTTEHRLMYCASIGHSSFDGKRETFEIICIVICSLLYTGSCWSKSVLFFNHKCHVLDVLTKIYLPEILQEHPPKTTKTSCFR